MAAQTLDVHVEGLGVAEIVRAPHPVDQDVAGEEAPRVLHQEREQLELLAAEMDLVAADEDQVAIGVDLDAAGLEHVLRGAVDLGLIALGGVHRLLECGGGEIVLRGAT